MVTSYHEITLSGIFSTKIDYMYYTCTFRVVSLTIKGTLKFRNTLCRCLLGKLKKLTCLDWLPGLFRTDCTGVPLIDCGGSVGWSVWALI